MKRLYSINAPDQQRLKIARAEIEGVLKKHDLAGVVVLHTPGMAEYFHDIRPSYSCVWLEEPMGLLRVKSKLADYGGDAAAQQHDLAATANMCRALSDQLYGAARMFIEIAGRVDKVLNAQHTDAVAVPDPMQAKPQ